ncbi:MAG: hypothetical protein BWZ10_01689 [candidate division BRC1 bacterium ADurb.BinA364]|nr:MAG: hypothetical protein BWZ10_01689 [candidate division BRC1 bacterium ADurb.BinA364]
MKPSLRTLPLKRNGRPVSMASMMCEQYSALRDSTLGDSIDSGSKVLNFSSSALPFLKEIPLSPPRPGRLQ